MTEVIVRATGTVPAVFRVDSADHRRVWLEKLDSIDQTLRAPVLAQGAKFEQATREVGCRISLVGTQNRSGLRATTIDDEYNLAYVGPMGRDERGYREVRVGKVARTNVDLQRNVGSRGAHRDAIAARQPWRK